jgi:hypothetical protein
MYNIKELTEYFKYLDDLCESGQTNMFGASLWLMSGFDLPKREAMDILGIWMNTFEDEVKPEERAKKHVAVQEL